MQTMTENIISMFTLGEIGEFLGALTEGAPGARQIPIKGVKIDSREVNEGDLFVAVKGQNLDGHEFISQAFAKGAFAAVIAKSFTSNSPKENEILLRVDDTLYALGEIAKYYRDKAYAKVIAVTGSNGKTTAKNMIYAVISNHAKAIKSQGNFNNLYGLPLSIFGLSEDTEYAVFELGMSRSGEISRLGEIASPDIGVITNIGPVHLEFFKDLRDIASAKLELVERIKTGGVIIINGDDELLKSRDEINKLKSIKFGLSYNNDIYPTDLSFDNNQFPSFKIDGAEISLRYPGIHNVYNALAAYSVAVAEGIEKSLAAEALNRLKPEGLRSRVIDKSGISFFIDCYNANPVSMKYAIDTLAAMECNGRRIAVLGDMLELGESSDRFHREIGKHAKKAGLDILLGFGEFAHGIVEEFGKGGEHFKEKTELISHLKKILGSGDLILFKGSRGMALEEIADNIMAGV